MGVAGDILLKLLVLFPLPQLFFVLLLPLETVAPLYLQLGPEGFYLLSLDLQTQ